MSIKASPGFSLKDQLFNADSVGRLAGALETAAPDFKARAYTREVLAQFPDLELKARIDALVTALEPRLPDSLAAACRILKRALPPPLDPNLSDNDFGQFIWVVPGEYVARHGVSDRHLNRSLEFLRESTKRFSAEWALRPFLDKYPDKTLEYVHRWTADKHYHVRRLASEGIRPLLPWGQRVVLPVPEVIKVLDRLYSDPTRFVTRSVANTLNDISKSDGEMVVATLKRWQGEGRQQPSEMEWITRHALRTLAKTDDPAVLGLLGYSKRPKVELAYFRVPRRVRVGEDLTVACCLRSLARQKLKVTLSVHFLKGNGAHSPKIFTLGEIKGDGVGTQEFSKRIAFRPMTTRTLYPGRHFAELLVNGKVIDKSAFTLSA